MDIYLGCGSWGFRETQTLGRSARRPCQTGYVLEGILVDASIDKDSHGHTLLSFPESSSFQPTTLNSNEPPCFLPSPAYTHDRSYMGTCTMPGEGLLSTIVQRRCLPCGDVSINTDPRANIGRKPKRANLSLPPSGKRNVVREGSMTSIQSEANGSCAEHNTLRRLTHRRNDAC